ncbi:MAG: hypothetical protein Q9209_004283 [Squamulea sp. 1 TL-2023]
MAPGQAMDIMRLRVIIVGAVFSALAITAVCGRIWARRIRHTNLQLNDQLMVIALVVVLGLNATITTGAISGGLGKHMASISLSEGVALAKANLAVGVLWVVGIACVKLSVLAFYISIFPNALFKTCAYLLAGLSVSLMTAMISASFLICPLNNLSWDTRGRGACEKSSALYLGGGVANILLDVAIVALPMPMLWGLQVQQTRSPKSEMKTSKKIALTVIFGLGALVCIISIVRVVAIANMNGLDLSYTLAAMGIWSMLVSSKELPDQDEWPLAKRDPEDRIYPLSDLAETTNEVEEDSPFPDAEDVLFQGIRRPSNHGHAIKKTSEFTVRSESRV